MAFCSILINADTRKVREDTLDGKPYLVVPMVMLTEGVHNGSSGPLYYSPSELRKVPQSWDSKPVVVNHPEKNGLGTSACTKAVIETQQVGVILNTKYDKKSAKLRAEAWLDPEKLELIDSRILEAINNNEIMEVSTGLFTDNIQSPGSFKGKKYSHVAMNFKPDHLAILPDKVGSCSVADGAGLMQANELSHDAIRDQLRRQVFDKYGERAWLTEIFATHAIYERDGDYSKIDYAIKDEKAELSGQSVEVERVVEYRPIKDMVDNVTTEKEPEKMPKTKEKDELVSALIDNESTAWTEDDRDFLAKKEIDELTKMAPIEKVVTENTEPPKAVPPKATEAIVDNDAKPATFEELLQHAPPEMQAVIRNGIAVNTANRQAMVDVIVANKRNAMKAEHLATLDDDTLAAMAVLATNEADEKKPSKWIGGAPAAPTGNAASDAIPLEMPSTRKKVSA